MSYSTLRLEQDLAYYQSLLTDQLKQLKLQRAQERNRINQILLERIPEIIETLYSRQDQQLLKLNPIFLNEQERRQRELLSQKLNRFRSGGCYNLPVEYEQLLRQHNRLFSLDVPDRTVTLCFDIAGPLQSELVNTNLNMVDVIINVGPNQSYQYPLTEEDSKRFLTQARQLGVDPGTYPQMRFPEIESTQEQIQFITLQMNPQLVI